MGLSPPPAAQSPDSIDQASVPLPGSLSCARSLNTMPYTPISVPIILNTCPLFHNTGHPRLFLHPSLCCWNILFPDLCSQPRYHVPRLYSHITAQPPHPAVSKPAFIGSQYHMVWTLMVLGFPWCAPWLPMGARIVCVQGPTQPPMRGTQRPRILKPKGSKTELTHLCRGSRPWGPCGPSAALSCSESA